MANTLLTPDVIAPRAIATLYSNLCMVPLSYTDVSRSFAGYKVGDTVNVRKPATFTANTFNRASGISIQNITETSIPVTLDTIEDVSVAITAEDLTLNLEDFNEQVLKPAMEALAQKIDRAILGLRGDITQEAGVGAGFEWEKPEVLIEADRLLNIQNVPPSERVAVVGPSTRAKWLNTDLIKHADKSGDTAALRRGSLGENIFGFDTYMTQNVDQPAGTPAAGQPTTEVGVAFHKSAFAFTSAPLALPSDNTWASSASFKGLNLRIVKQYDNSKKQEVISIDTLFGVKTIDPNRAVLLKGADAA